MGLFRCMDRIGRASGARVAGIATTASESGVSVVNGVVRAAAPIAACGSARSGSVTTDEPWRAHRFMKDEDGPRVFEHACRLGFEGIVSKRRDSLYQSGRCHHWLS